MKWQTRELPYRVGVFDTVTKADEAIASLLAAGIRNSELAVICSNKENDAHFQQFAHVRTPKPAGTSAPRGAAAGGVMGASVGGLSLVATALTTGGGAALLAAGGVLIGGLALTGSLVGLMTARGFDKETADYYDQALEQGKILVVVEIRAPQRVHLLHEAEEILRAVGVHPVPLGEG